MAVAMVKCAIGVVELKMVEQTIVIGEGIRYTKECTVQRELGQRRGTSGRKGYVNGTKDVTWID
jgi:hypothetical protein